MLFIGRQKEQEIIKNLLKHPNFKSCIIYGRRRMGKTYLLKHCLEDITSPVIFFQCKEASADLNAQLLSELIGEVLGFKNLYFKSFFDALKYLFDYSLNKELVLVIDEYPYIRNKIEGCDSYLQELIDTYNSKAHLKLFLCGSSISVMEDIQSGNQPLYMRFDQSILLKQMDYYDSSLFYPTFSLEEKVMLYSAFGGVPFYNARIESHLSVKDNIIKLLSGQFANIEEYIDIYLKAELRKIDNAYAVFSAIACGAFHYTDILNKSKIDASSALTTILQKLIKMDLITYVTPINKVSKQKGGYRISDNSISFYFNYIYRHVSFHEVLDDEVFYDRYIKDDFEKRFVPHTFELITKEYLIRYNKKGLLDPLLINIGTYWYDNPLNHTNGQFDVVGQCEEGYIFFECKYTDTPITDGIIKEELEQVGKTTLKAYQYGFVSKVGFDLKNKYNYIFITLEDMYK